MANSFWDALKTDKPFIPPQGTTSATSSKKPSDENKQADEKVSQASLERMTGAVGLPPK